MGKTSRPSRMTMAGMVYDANQSLKWVMKDPDIKENFRQSSAKIITLRESPPKLEANLEVATKHHGSVRSQTNADMSNKSNTSKNSVANLFSDEDERDLLGIGFFTIFEGGLVISGYHGRGIVMSRNIVTGSWSPPVAVGLSGVGAGLLIGASARSLVYLIYDYFTLESIVGTREKRGGFIVGVGAGATIGHWSKQRGSGSSYITSAKTLRSVGMGSHVAISRGLAGFYCALSVEGGICKSRDEINSKFYGRDDLTGSDILMSGEIIDIPEESTINGKFVESNIETKRLIEEVHWKLEQLCSGDSIHGFDSQDSKDTMEKTENAPTQEEEPSEALELKTMDSEVV